MKIKEEWYKRLVLDYSYVVTDTIEDPINFGNAAIILSSSTLLIRYVVDRSDVRIEVASHSNSKNWFDLDIIYAYLNDTQNLTEKYSFDEMNTYLMNNHEAIRNLFTIGNCIQTKGRLTELMNLRAKQLFSHLDNS
jgi:hypothetical protein